MRAATEKNEYANCFKWAGRLARLTYRLPVIAKNDAKPFFEVLRFRGKVNDTPRSGLISHVKSRMDIQLILWVLATLSDEVWLHYFYVDSWTYRLSVSLVILAEALAFRPAHLLQ